MFSQVTQIRNIYQLPPAVESLKWCKIPGADITNLTEDAQQNPDDVNFDRLLPTLFECFAIVFCGFLAGRCNLISRSDIKGLNDFTTYFSLPPLIFLNLVTINFQNVNWYFVLGILLGKIIVFSLVALVTALVQRPVNLSYAGIYGIFCTQGNDFGLAYPIVASLYGSKRPLYAGYMYLIAPTSLLFTNPMGFFLMEVQKNCSAVSQSSASSTKRESKKNIWKTVTSVSWAVFKNPVVFVTLLGILGNFLFQDGLPSVLYGTLQILSSAFSASVLFLLGFSAAGCTLAKSPSKEGLLIPFGLIMAKMMLSPLITRGTVAILCSASPDLEDLADYGFLYGMVPTGPIVMLFAAEYLLKTEMMASTMVVCTALFGPVMFVLARMLSLKIKGLQEFAHELNTTVLVLSILSILSCLWVASCFLIGKKTGKHIYRITSCLLLSQAVLAVGFLVWAVSPEKDRWLSFLQVGFIASGLLMSRIWATLLALTLVIQQRNPFSPFIQNISWPLSFGFGVPAACIVMLLVLMSVGKCHPDLHHELPLFSYGPAEAVVSITILSVCLIATICSVVLYYRSVAKNVAIAKRNDVEHLKRPETAINFTEEQRKGKPPKDLLDGAGLAVYKLTKSISDSSVFKSAECSDSKRIEKSDKSTLAMCNVCSQSSLDIVSVSSSETSADSNETDFKIYRHLRHVILLLVCCISMAVSLTLNTWKLSSDQTNGLFVSMEFLDVVLSVGQGVFLTVIFWRESKYIFGPLSKWVLKVKRGLYTLDEGITDDATKQLCLQFKRFHCDNCLRDLPRTISTQEETFDGCFTGRDLVDWLITVGLADHRTAAELYGQRLVRGGVLRSCNGAVQFHDCNGYFYSLTDNDKFT